MSESQQRRETAVEQVRRVRDELNREIEAAGREALRDRIRGHRFASPTLERLASKAVAKQAAEQSVESGLSPRS